MSNIKQVWITGWMPYDAGRDDKLLSQIGEMALPDNGICLAFKPDQLLRVKNTHNGIYLYNQFEVTGNEAIGVGWLNRFVENVEGVGGIVTDYCITDMEAGEEIHDYHYPVEDRTPDKLEHILADRLKRLGN